MKRLLFSADPIFPEQALGTLRILTGLMMAYHGAEVFDAKTIQGYAEWDVIKAMPYPLFMAYLGKGLEFVSGICFVFGAFTRIASFLMAADMLFICFKIGHGKFYYDDQHPFLFALIALLFIFTGPGSWALDSKFWKKGDA